MRKVKKCYWDVAKKVNFDITGSDNSAGNILKWKMSL